MTLPARLLQAVSTAGGGKIALVVGAGCSLEEPTCIPLASTCSYESHERLVANGVLSEGDCEDPYNLSKLADVLHANVGTQAALVEQLVDEYGLKTASPNDGHMIAVALLSEGAVSSILTLNFDLAFSVAVADLGAGDSIGVIDGPHEFGKQKAANVFYLHRNANEPRAEDWVLRTAALEEEWKGGWEDVVANKLLTSPAVVFVGLGSPADVLVESSKKVKGAVNAKSVIYQVDPGNFETNTFAKALEIPAENFIKLGWVDFMVELSDRLVAEQIANLSKAAGALVAANGLQPEDVSGLLARLKSLGLVECGKLRASWLLHSKAYRADDLLGRQLVADIILSVGQIARIVGADAIIFSNGVVEIRKEGRVLAPLIFASGAGVRTFASMEAAINMRVKRLRGLAAAPIAAVVSGVVGPMVVSPPADVIIDDQSQSIVFGGAQMAVVSAESLRAQPDQIGRLVA